MVASVPLYISKYLLFEVPSPYLLINNSVTWALDTNTTVNANIKVKK